jgi:hypothetical protein
MAAFSYVAVGKHPTDTDFDNDPNGHPRGGPWLVVESMLSKVSVLGSILTAQGHQPRPCRRVRGF